MSCKICKRILIDKAKEYTGIDSIHLIRASFSELVVGDIYSNIRYNPLETEIKTYNGENLNGDVYIFNTLK